MADITDTLGRSLSDKECVWNEMQKVGLIEDFIYQIEEDFTQKNKRSKEQQQKAKDNRPLTLSYQATPAEVSKTAERTLIHLQPDSQDNKGLSSN
ncbi:spermatogenesis-associated protein 16-like [Erpetoichthys calabaricus]|uniref:spermatogenesis-associated protein 16-like n=1 Tax=Erpetoichthys calabaricus TaxID=27687 RepID=UPI002234540A|nr:spermatogenesis-associated protein 16-like [Erpetoichthys calabaricus]